MKKFFICLGLAAIMLAPSCENDPTSDILNGSENNTESGIENGVENGEGEAVAYLSVGINNAGTNANTNTNTNTTADSRISVGEENEEGRVPLYWNAGDKLVVNRKIETLAIGDEFNGKDMAEFGLTEEALSQITYPITLLYPATSMTSSSTKHFYIDTEQEYLQGHLSNGYGILMGKAEKKGDGISMEHMCGYMRVSLTGSATVKKVMLRTVGHEPISGFFNHHETANEIGMTSYTSSGIADGYYNSPVIAIDCGEEGVTLSDEATDFYFALPAGTYSKGFVLHVLGDNNLQHRVKVYGSGKTISAGVMLKMPALQVNCTKNWGIFDGNELASFGRTLAKNAWLGVNETTIYLRNDIDMQNETFTDLPKDSNHRAFIIFRSGEYANDKITVIDGKKSETENYTIYNLKKSLDTDGGLLFATIPDHLTVQNITLGRVADNPDTEEIEADCILSLDPDETNYTYVGAFSYVIKGTVKNCINNASINGTVVASQGLKVGIFSGSTSSCAGTIDSCVNNGSIIMDATNGKTENFVAGIMANNVSSTISNCTNNGAIKITGATAATNIAGITGQTGANSTTTNCYNYGAISLSGATNTIYMGGVVGYNKSTTLISGCHNHGAANISNADGSGTTVFLGGVIGISKGDMSDCHNHGAVTISNTNKSAHIGGVVGRCDNPMAECTNESEVSVSAQAAVAHIGGIVGTGYKLVTSCTNTGNVTLNDATAESYVGGILGYNEYAPVTDDAGNTSSQLLTGCVNGQKDTEKGKITVKYKTAAKAYVGGVCAYSGKVISGVNKKATIATNYAPISVDKSAQTFAGGIWGYVATNSILAGYKNYGDLTVTNAGNSSWSYCGGVGGNCNKDNKTYYCDCTANVTMHFPNGKIRAGLIMPYFATAANCNGTGTVHIQNETKAGSEIGGLGGFSNGGKKSGCKFTGTVDNDATGVMTGGLVGAANGSTWSNCTIKVTLESVDPTTTGFITSRAESDKLTIKLGESESKPLKINKASTFNGITASSSDVFSNYEESGFINFCNTHASYQLTVDSTYVTFVD